MALSSRRACGHVGIRRIALLCMVVGIGQACSSQRDDPARAVPVAGAGAGVDVAAFELVSGKQPKRTALYTRFDPTTIYEWAAPDAPIARALPKFAVVVVGSSTPKNGYYQVNHAGTWGWIHGEELVKRHGPIDGLSPRRADALERAQAAMGFSYWWSNARWHPGGPTVLPQDNTGSCSGKCPKCTHRATGPVEYGADCSGFVSTIWGFWDTDSETNPSNNGFATKAYAKANPNWRTIALQEAITGDAMVRHDAKRQHIFLVGENQIGRGRVISYECIGCEAGCQSNVRYTADLDDWKAIRRTSWPTY